MFNVRVYHWSNCHIFYKQMSYIQSKDIRNSAMNKMYYQQHVSQHVMWPSPSPSPSPYPNPSPQRARDATDPDARAINTLLNTSPADTHCPIHCHIAERKWDIFRDYIMHPFAQFFYQRDGEIRSPACSDEWWWHCHCDDSDAADSALRLRQDMLQIICCVGTGTSDWGGGGCWGIVTAITTTVLKTIV